MGGVLSQFAGHFTIGHHWKSLARVILAAVEWRTCRSVEAKQSVPPHGRSLSVRRRYSKDPSIDKSLRHSVKDGVAYSVMAGGGESYFSAFALFLKATTEQIALLASLPPLLGSFAQLVSA